MPERSTVVQVVQLGAEATPGTAVPANKKLVALSINPSASLNLFTFRPMGYKFRTFAASGKEWSVASVEGLANYEELQYVFTSILMNTTGAGAGADKTWTFTPAAAALDTLKTFTIERGDSTQAERITYGQFVDFSMRFNRDEVRCAGRLIGQRMITGVALTASPTELPTKPVLPKDVSVYLDNTAAGIGTTKLTRALEVEWRVQNRVGPLWVIDAAQTSFAATVELEPTAEVRLRMEADSPGMALLADARAGTTKFMRVRATGDPLGGGTYRLDLDMALKAKAVGEFSDADGVYAIEYTFDVVYDSGWGKAMQVVLVNSQATL